MKKIIEVRYEPSLYVGHYERVSDVFDGAYGDDDYDCYEYQYLAIKWEKIL